MNKRLWVFVVLVFVFGICLGILIDGGIRKLYKEEPRHPIYLHTGNLSIPLGQ
jgi:hypothetical protein